MVGAALRTLPRVIAVLAVVAALLHPGGLPSLLSITSDGATVVVDWSAPPDDVAVIATVAGGQDRVAGYVLDRVAVFQEGRTCPGEVTAAREDAVSLAYRCPGPVAAVTVRATIFEDVDPSYQTLAVAPTVEGPDRVLFTGTRTEQRFVLAAGAPAEDAAPALPRPTLGFERRLLAILDDGAGPLGIAAVGAALLVGAGHALAPGHGKSVAAMYLVGSRGRNRHAVALGATVAGMHTASVLAVGGLVWTTARTGALDRSLPWVGVAAGVAVTALGVRMTARHLRGTPVHAHAGHAHPGEPGRGWVAVVGASGGLLPSPSALAALLAALAAGRLGLGLAVVGAFSIGLAAAVTAVGVAALRGRDLLRRLPRFVGRLPVAGSVGVVLAGAYLTVLAIRDAAG